MASTLVKINVHLVFHVKSTGITMREDDLEKVFSYLGGIIRGIGGAPIQIGGMTDHVHILSTLPKTLSLADFVRTIKADSSKWIKTLDDYYQPFAWQEGYGAFSVSSSQMKNTIRYIQRQPEHHKNGHTLRSIDSSWRHTVSIMMSDLLLKFDSLFCRLFKALPYFTSSRGSASF